MATPEDLNTDNVSSTAQEIKSNRLAAAACFGVFTGIALADVSVGIMSLTNPTLRAHSDVAAGMAILIAIGAVSTPVLARRTINLLRS